MVNQSFTKALYSLSPFEHECNHLVAQNFARSNIQTFKEFFMKGVVFTEFLDMVESRFGAQCVEDIIDASDLPSGGAYTAVGTYSHEEIVALVEALSMHSNLPVPTLLKVYGEHLFGRFAALYPMFFLGQTNAIDFLSGIEDVIHTEVKKLYPDAQLPKFEVISKKSDFLELLYISAHQFEDLAEGLIAGCIKYFGKPLNCERREAVMLENTGSRVHFIITEI
jgi:Haem-NO-binding